MSVLVTGAAGFIGSHVVDRLLASGCRVIGMDAFDPFYDRQIKERNLRAAHGSSTFSLIEADIRDRSALEGLPEDIDIVVHLAALAGVRPSIEDPSRYAAVNVQGTVELLEWMRRRGIGRFVFASSSSVYGDHPDVPFREDHRVDQPISPYAATKAAGELACHAAHHLHGLSVAVLRLFTVYGPRQRPDLAIHKFARLLRDGRPVPMYGDGSSARDYTYVDDLVDGLVAAMDLVDGDTSRFEVINLGESRTITLQRMIETLAEALGVEARVEALPDQAGDVRRTYADIDRARRLLGYEPRTDFRDGVARFVRWLDMENA